MAIPLAGEAFTVAVVWPEEFFPVEDEEFFATFYFRNGFHRRRVGPRRFDFAVRFAV